MTIQRYQRLYILKVKGEHRLLFKAKHHDSNYLHQVAGELIHQEKTHFTDYEVYPSDHSNAEMTQS